MKSNRKTQSDLEIPLEDFTAELTTAAYAVALRHGARGKWLDLQLELWKALKETVKKWEQESLISQRCVVYAIRPKPPKKNS